MLERIICIVIGYACGLLQTGFLYGKTQHIDIREHGSGNVGTTNALRTLGWKAGAITFLGDCLKCITAMLIVRAIFAGSHPEELELLALYAGAGAVLGHNFPFYMKFKGGKGIAATAGIILVTNPVMLLISAGLFLLVVGITRYVSLGSLFLVTSFAIEVIVWGQMGGFRVQPPQLYEMYVIVLLLMALAFYQHRANIKRLVSGTENKLSFGKSKK